MAIILSDLLPAVGSTKKRKRIGKGSGSGHGKTSCRGHKGQKSRAGYSRKLGFEGGQMPLARRIPKRGFTSIYKNISGVVNLEDLNAFKDGTEVNPDVLVDQGLVRKNEYRVKVLGTGTLTRKLSVKAHAFSKTAEEKIIACGGTVEVIKN